MQRVDPIIDRIKIPPQNSRTARGNRRVLFSPTPSPAALGAQYAAVFVVLIHASELKFRERPVELSVQGVIDAQVVGELLIWAICGFWILQRFLRSHKFLLGSPRVHLSASLRILFVIGATLFVSSIQTARTLSVVRAAQYWFLIFLVVLIYSEWHRGVLEAHSFFRWIRRFFVALVVTWSAASQLFARIFPLYVTYNGFQRYAWFQTYPIATAAMLGVGILFIVAMLLDPREAWAAHRERRIALVATALWLGFLLLETRSRGPTIATVLALGLFVGTAPLHRLRGGALLGSLTLVAAGLIGLLDAPLASVFFRGQTTTELQELSGRSELLAYAWRLFSQRPLLGYGYLSTRSLFLEQFPWAGHSHNLIAEIAVSAGAVGLLLYLLLFISVGRELRQGLRGRDEERALSREAAALATFTFAMGVIDPAFAASPGLEVGLLVLVVLSASLAAVGARSSPTGTRSHLVSDRI